MESCIYPYFFGIWVFMVRCSGLLCGAYGLQNVFCWVFVSEYMFMILVSRFLALQAIDAVLSEELW